MDTLKNDLDLIKKIIAGDRGSFDYFYHSYFQKIYNYLFLTLQSRRDTEHLVEEIFTHAVHALEHFDGYRSLDCFMFSIIRSALASHGVTHRMVSSG